MGLPSPRWTPRLLALHDSTSRSPSIGHATGRPVCPRGQLGPPGGPPSELHQTGLVLADVPLSGAPPGPPAPLPLKTSTPKRLSTRHCPPPHLHPVLPVPGWPLQTSKMAHLTSGVFAAHCLSVVYAVHCAPALSAAPRSSDSLRSRGAWGRHTYQGLQVLFGELYPCMATLALIGLWKPMFLNQKEATRSEKAKLQQSPIGNPFCQKE